MTPQYRVEPDESLGVEAMAHQLAPSAWILAPKQITMLGRPHVYWQMGTFAHIMEKRMSWVHQFVITILFIIVLL